MTADSSGPKALRRVKRKNYFVCAAILAGGVVVQGVVSDDIGSAFLLVQLGWSVGFVVLGLMVGAGWIAVKSSGFGSGLVSLVGVTALIHLTGGPYSPFFPLLIGLPLALAMFTPDTRTPTIVITGGMLGAVVMLDGMAGMPLRRMLLQVSGFGVLGGVAIVGSQTYQRMRGAERSAQQERLEALERLAESERLRMRAERERTEVERLVMVGQLAAGVAHEVNNPLAFVKSNLCFIEDELKRESTTQDRAELYDVLAETQQGVLRIQQIVSDLRRFSREGDESGEQGRPEDAMHEAKRLASVRLRGLGEASLDIAPGLPAVRLGQRHLVQVLLNLLLNAVDAVETAVPARRALIWVRAQTVDGKVQLEVEDNGPGIPPDVLPKLFEPFFTTKPPGKGTGLGLALCREYVSRAGGTLHAENRPEGGARFVLVLPAVPKPASAAA
ncbi:sensor histidine kinase [Vitiosangium sp. GDMCC 1.1324]|uniref:sensor histidine kinase n=1 Tax=Vitiosangium sp. (strain GDMCC 1.1324) TaxID=2138576 RepID=UPI000D396E2C|nr:ATP-binding protein [Vitiosangium sp. GDMCC 1.1324]PTL79916.1 histidine kinase [Vitiosangium sp. GDMCC 1.1324]